MHVALEMGLQMTPDGVADPPSFTSFRKCPQMTIPEHLPPQAPGRWRFVPLACGEPVQGVSDVSANAGIVRRVSLEPVPCQRP